MHLVRRRGSLSARTALLLIVIFGLNGIFSI
ncbi:hypothetical protein LINPERPRIM_LOCUS20453 [Linum perenne]